jgi:hypothetical protein
MKALTDIVTDLEARRSLLREELHSVDAAITALSGKPKPAVSARKSNQRRPMSAQAKAALSSRMKKYWAAKRAKK